MRPDETPAPATATAGIDAGVTLCWGVGPARAGPGLGGAALPAVMLGVALRVAFTTRDRRLATGKGGR